MYLSLRRKWDYASWDKNGNPITCSRYFKFKNVEIVINRNFIYLGIFENKDAVVCNEIFRIENGKFLLNVKNDRLIINVIENKNKYYPNDKLLNGIYVSISYYEDYNTTWNYNFENKQEFYIISKYAYNKEKWIGIIKNDIDEFFNIMKEYRYLDILGFKDVIKEYDDCELFYHTNWFTEMV